MDKKYVRHELKEVFLYVFLVVFFTLIISLYAGFVTRGFEPSISSGIIHI